MAKSGSTQATGARKRRPAPSRTSPDRSGWTATEADPTPGPDPTPSPDEVLAADVERVVADAVKLGYEVIGHNLHQGRVAASRISRGAYGVSEAKDDVMGLGRRLLQLSGDMGRVWIDLVTAVVNDKDLHDAVRPRPVGDGPASPAPGGSVPLAVIVKGNPKASGASTGISLPEKPSELSCPGLHAAVADIPPVTQVGFAAGSDGKGAVAIVQVPADQPACRYSGVVLDAATHAVLGTLTVEVQA